MRTPTRIILVLFLAFLVIVLALGSAVYFFLDKYSYNDLYIRLQTRAQITANHHFDADRMSAEAIQVLREKYLQKMTDEQEYVLVLQQGRTAPGSPIDGILNDGFMEAINGVGSAFAKNGNTFYAGIRYETAEGPYLVVVSADNYYASHHLSYLKRVLLVGALLVTLTSIAFFVYFSRKIFDPIDRITKRVKQISTENLHLRVEDSGTDREISSLINTFNDLLDRLETAFETQKNFISNASHEFGTPLTAIIGEAEVTLSKERAPADYQEALGNVLVQAERLDKITKSLLFLAQTGYTTKRINTALVRMDEVIIAVKAMLDDLHPKNNLMIDFSLLPENPKKLKVWGNADLLKLAIGNIANNACKYSQNKPVNISVAAGQGEVIIIVVDQGIGIPEKEMAFIYDPFYRASNTAYFDGFGIGLPLTRNIIRLHGGKLEVNSAEGKGTTVRVNLPAAFADATANA
ncbi:MAG: HAMP domain-containing histidine kinase [Flavobacteriales bacterium]|nr:HAMP domain-containing histidine kinase [Flavobacteriales bacterium]